MRMMHASPRSLQALLQAALVFLLLAAMPCQAVTNLTLAHIYKPEHPTAKACQFFAETVKSRSQGRLQVNVYGEASMGNQQANLKTLRNGSLDLAIVTEGVLAEIVPEFNALGLPYLFSDTAAAWRVLDGSIGEQLRQKALGKGVVHLTFWDVEVRHFSNSVRPILKPADLSGLKVRIPPEDMSAEIVTALGAQPKEINFSDLYLALRNGLVDGQENPLINFRVSRLYEVQKYLSLTGHKFVFRSFLMSKAAMSGLSAKDQEIIQGAARDAARYQRKLASEAEADSYRDLVARGVRINAVDVKPFVAATLPVYDKWYDSPIGGFVRSVVQAAQERE